MGSKLGSLKGLFSLSGQPEKSDELSVLCPTCLFVLKEVMERARGHLDGSNRQTFGKRIEWGRVFEVKQSLVQLQSSADDGCHFCFLRLEDLCDLTDASYRSLIANETYKAEVRWSHNKPEAWNVTLFYGVAIKTMSRFKFQSEVKQNPTSRIKQAPAVDKDNGGSGLSAEDQDQKWEVARTWLKDCAKGHRACSSVHDQGKESSFYPTRLIDIGLGPDMQPRLRDSYALPPGMKYMTLSHCWGKLKILKLLETNIEDMKQIIDTSQLCPTFLDAMEATRILGVQYLWIDSLCIMQDSHNDWAHESAMMHDVYRHSWCNLAATSAEDGSHGMLHHLASRNEMSARPIRLKMKVKSKDIVFIGYNEALWVDQIDRGPLKTRGWVVQELVLAPRVLHFGKHQLFWDCARLRACEMLQSGPSTEFEIMNRIAPGCIMAPEKFKNRTELNGKDAYRWSRIMQWMELVEEYSQCKLTMASDRLVAVSGLAKSMKLDVGYWAGIWGAFVGRQLMWHIPEPRAKKSSVSSSTLAPSWSWVASGEHVLFRPNRWVDGDHGVLTVMDVHVSLISDDPTGAVSGGCMRVEGALIKAKKNDKFVDFLFDFEDEDDPADNLYLLPVMWQAYAGDYSGLILEPTTKADAEYRRRGCFATKFSPVRGIPQALKNAHSSFENRCADSISQLTTKHYVSARASPEYGHVFTIILV